MKTYGLIGYPLSHSFSKKYFTEKFLNEGIEDHQYELFPIENIDSLADLINNNPDLSGLNVTIPHKVNVLPFLNEIEPAAEQIGAVNCISIRHFEGECYLKGYNTDAYGFAESLKPLLTPQHIRALVLGNGGASKAVKYVLQQLSIDFKAVSRKPKDGTVLYTDLTSQIIADHKLIINTTPLGMSPNTDTFPEIDYESLGPDHLAYDLVYNPLETVFLAKAAAQGAAIKNGLEMLYKQAEKAWTIWNH